MRAEVIQGDCLEVMRELEAQGRRFDLCLTDPPYGVEINRRANNFGSATEHSRRATKEAWDDFTPTPEYFKQIFKISKHQVVFGANYFWENFYSSQCYIVWDKRADLPDVPFADTEFAWTSFIDKPCKRYVIRNHGFIRDSKDIRTGHPTQKPTELVRAILRDFTKPNDWILDPFMGSGSTGVACVIEERNFIGIEQSADYCAIAEARIRRAQGEPCDIPRLVRSEKVLPLFADGMKSEKAERCKPLGNTTKPTVKDSRNRCGVAPSSGSSV